MNRGQYWASSNLSMSLYNHTVSPGSHSCLNGELVIPGAWTAGSRHPGGVNTLFADGHVSFVQKTIANRVWQAISSRAGGELVSQEDLSY